MLLVILNIAFYIIMFWKYTTNISAWDIADKAAESLRFTDSGYTLSDEIAAGLKEQNVWAILIDDNTRQVIWQTENLPNNIPKQYTLSDISDLSRGYVDGYPTFTGEAKNGLLVLGYPRDSYWKLVRASWDYHFIASLPKNVLSAFCMNIILMFLIYAITNSRLLRSIKPITNGIQDLSHGTPVQLSEKGILSELAANINQTSSILQKQAEQLRKKETARANWIAGVSHDIRTPLSMVMGYAGQLENTPGLTEAERKKASVIVKQSERMKNLINDLNKDLLKRAVTNLVQNSITHNEQGCAIYVSVAEHDNNCIICVEDDGVGVSDEQIEKLNNTPHYMVCDSNTFEQRQGLGLLIVKQIANSHNGTVLIAHSEYGGFKVSIEIPK